MDKIFFLEATYAYEFDGKNLTVFQNTGCSVVWYEFEEKFPKEFPVRLGLLDYKTQQEHLKCLFQKMQLQHGNKGMQLINQIDALAQSK